MFVRKSSSCCSTNDHKFNFDLPKTENPQELENVLSDVHINQHSLNVENERQVYHFLPSNNEFKFSFNVEDV